MILSSSLLLLRRHECDLKIECKKYENKKLFEWGGWMSILSIFHWNGEHFLIYCMITSFLNSCVRLISINLCLNSHCDGVSFSSSAIGMQTIPSDKWIYGPIFNFRFIEFCLFVCMYVFLSFHFNWLCRVVHNIVRNFHEFGIDRKSYAEENKSSKRTKINFHKWN